MLLGRGVGVSRRRVVVHWRLTTLGLLAALLLTLTLLTALLTLLATLLTALTLLAR